MRYTKWQFFVFKHISKCICEIFMLSLIHILTASMADKAIVHTMKLTVKEGVYFLTMNFQGLTVGDKLGYLGTLRYYQTGYTTDARGNIPVSYTHLYTSLKKQHMMMKLVMAFYEKAVEALSGGASLQDLINMPVREQIGRFKYVHEDDLDTDCLLYTSSGETSIMIRVWW